VIEKLLENWLDSASERSYQAVFVQMLSAEGYTVLHSTRHCLLEFGKDILAIDPDGVGCAFQLKGDPGGRMTISHFRSEIQGQLLQLTTQFPNYPGFPQGRYRSFLVSNGQFEEEVQTAVAQMNAGAIPSKIELWSRGHLLDLSKKHGALLWPSELQDNRALLELYLAPAHSQVPAETLAEVLESVLRLREADNIVGRNDLARRATSAAWLTGICTSTFAEAKNHQAIVHAWSMCCAALIAAQVRHSGLDSVPVCSALSLAEAALKDALTELWNEVRSHQTLIQGNPLTDTTIHGWRVTCLFGLLTSLAIANSDGRLLESESGAALTDWLCSTRYSPLLWGEAAFASLAPWLVWLRKTDATSRVDDEIAGLTESIVTLNQPENAAALVAPHYTFEEWFRSLFNDPNVHRHGPLDNETSHGCSSISEAALHLLVRTNRKRACKVVWSKFSRLTHRRVALDESWHFGLRRAPGGVEESRIFPSTYTWDSLKADAIAPRIDTRIPNHFLRSPWLLIAWLQVAPHRMDRDSLYALVESIVPGWGT